MRCFAEVQDGPKYNRWRHRCKAAVVWTARRESGLPILSCALHKSVVSEEWNVRPREWGSCGWAFRLKEIAKQKRAEKRALLKRLRTPQGFYRIVLKQRIEEIYECQCLVRELVKEIGDGGHEHGGASQVAGGIP